MLTVPEAARRIGRNPETVRRWIRAGKLRSQRVGTQHLIDENDLDSLVGADEDDMLPLPEEWKLMVDGRPQPNWVRIIHRSREGR
jgi:excisionase family DNA binding protein